MNQRSINLIESESVLVSEMEKTIEKIKIKKSQILKSNGKSTSQAGLRDSGPIIV